MSEEPGRSGPDTTLRFSSAEVPGGPKATSGPLDLAAGVALRARASGREGSQSGGGGLLHGYWVRGWAVDCDAPQARRGQQWFLRPPSVGGVGVPQVDGLVGNVAHGVDEGVAALRIQVSLEAAHWVGNVQALLTSRLREQRQQAGGDAEKIRGESNRSGTERCGGDSAGRCIHADHPLC